MQSQGGRIALLRRPERGRDGLGPAAIAAKRYARLEAGEGLADARAWKLIRRTASAPSARPRAPDRCASGTAGSGAERRLLRTSTISPVCRDSGRARPPLSAFRHCPSLRMGSRADAASGPLAPAHSAPIAPRSVPAGPLGIDAEPSARTCLVAQSPGPPPNETRRIAKSPRTTDPAGLTVGAAVSA